MAKIVTHDGHKYEIKSGDLVVHDKYRGRGEARMRELIEHEAAKAAGFINCETGEADLIAYRQHSAS